jgi:hypothetical protein
MVNNINQYYYDAPVLSALFSIFAKLACTFLIVVMRFVLSSFSSGADRFFPYDRLYVREGG